MSNNSSNNPATPAIFQFTPSFQVRVIAINNEPWFCLHDVCKILDLKIASPARFGCEMMAKVLRLFKSVVCIDFRVYF